MLFVAVYVFLIIIIFTSVCPVYKEYQKLMAKMRQIKLDQGDGKVNPAQAWDISVASH